MPSSLKAKLAALAAIAGLQTAAATTVAFRSEAECSGVITYVAANVTEPVSCYSIEDYGFIPSVNVARLTAGQVVNFFSDGACAETAAVATDDGCYDPSQGSFGSFSIMVPSSDSSVSTHTDAAATYSIKMSNYTDMAMTDPYNVDLALSVPFVAAVVAGSASLGLTIYGAWSSCEAFKEDTNLANGIACIGGPLAVICGITSTHLYQRAGNVVNARINQATGTTSNVKRQEVVDGALHEYLGALPNSMHVGYLQRRDDEQPGPMYEFEGMAGEKYHIAAFFDEETGSLSHHLHPAQDTATVKRDAPYPYNDIRWDRGGLEWNICTYNSASTYNQFNNQPSSYYDTYYDQLTCIYPTVDPYKSATTMMIDIHAPDGTTAGELEIIPFSGSSPSKSAPSCTTSLAPINQDCQVN